ncbi:MAG: hypothetical protein QM765_27335 [Myxococcales bacterium]
MPILHFHLFNIVSSVLPARFHCVRAAVLRQCGAAIAKNVRLNAAVRVYGGNIEVGEDTWVSSETVFFTGVGAPVRIGPRCDVGHGASFVTGSHELGGSFRRAGPGHSQEIVVGAGCWIGACSVILGGAKIGDGSVVAAGAIVLPGDYPPNVLLAGVPAVVKKKLPEEEAR